MTIKAIIFDVDGTLADTEDGHRKSFNKAFAENGLDWNWDVALYDKLLKVTGGKERIKYYADSFLTGYKKPDDFDEFVKHLHKAKTAHYTTMRPGIKSWASASSSSIHHAHAAGIKPKSLPLLLRRMFPGAAGSWYGKATGNAISRPMAAATSCRTRNPRRIFTSGCWTSSSSLQNNAMHRTGRFEQRPAFGNCCRHQDLCHNQSLYTLA